CGRSCAHAQGLRWRHLASAIRFDCWLTISTSGFRTSMRWRESGCRNCRERRWRIRISRFGARAKRPPNRVADDFSDRWSVAKADFEHRLFQKRNRVTVSFVELDDTIPMHGPQAEI